MPLIVELVFGVIVSRIHSKCMISVMPIVSIGKRL